MHTLYMVYDEDDKVTDFKIDDVSTAENFISLDKGPLSYLQSIIDNLNAYIKKNGSLTVDNNYITQIRHGNFDQTYSAIEDKRTEDPNYDSKSNPASSASSTASSSASSATSSASSTTSSSATTSAASSASAAPAK